MADESQLHILIIGGGVAGLALAQLLQTNVNVHCSVFDRDSSPEARHQKWSVSLSTLIPRLGPLTVASNTRHVGLVDSGAIIDCHTGKQRVRWGREMPGPGFFIHANRQKIRQYLSRGCNVSWNKRFVRYEEDEHGVTAFFEDGTQARGDLLVGVDGSNSRVRNQLLQGVTELDTNSRPYAMIGAEIKVSATEHESLSSISDSFYMTMTNGAILHSGLQTPLLPKSEHDYSKDKGPAFYYFHLYIPDPAAANLNTDNINNTDETPYWTQTASASELRQRANDFTKEWKGPVREVVALAKDEDMLTPPFLLRDWCPPENLVLPRGRVTLMGDAAHQMTPFRGTGANTAMLDAIDLADLVDSITLPAGSRPADRPAGPPPGFRGGPPTAAPSDTAGPPFPSQDGPPKLHFSDPPREPTFEHPGSKLDGPPSTRPPNSEPPSSGPPANAQPAVPADAASLKQPKPSWETVQKALDDYWGKALPRGRETVLASRHALERDPNGDTTVEMITKAMSGGGPPPGLGGPPVGGPSGKPPAGYDGTEADARRGLMWRG